MLTCATWNAIILGGISLNVVSLCGIFEVMFDSIAFAIEYASNSDFRICVSVWIRRALLYRSLASKVSFLDSVDAFWSGDVGMYIYVVF